MQPVGRDHQQRGKRDGSCRKERACNAADEVAECNRPEAARSRCELAQDERTGELALVRPATRDEVLVDARKVAEPSRGEEGCFEDQPEEGQEVDGGPAPTPRLNSEATLTAPAITAPPPSRR